MVEVLGRYSNHADQGERIDQVIRTASQGSAEPRARHIKKVNRRLTTDQVDDLIQAYGSGVTLAMLGDRFGQNRKTLARALERRGVSRRCRLMTDEGLHHARSAYESGKSMAEIGEELGVSRDAVRLALWGVGVKMRSGRFGER